MKILINTLPSRGYGNPEIKYIDIDPLTYRELRNYTSKKYESGTVDHLVWDIECLIQDIPGWESLSSFDISAIMFTRKYISATFDDNIKVNIGNNIYQINMSDINFKDLNNDLKLINKIIINERVFLFNIPTIEQYYNILKSISQGGIKIDGEIDLDIVYLASCLINITTNESKSLINRKSYATIKRENYKNFEESANNFIVAYNAINNCTHGDVTFINRLLHLLTDKTHDVTVLIEGGETAVNLDRLIADIFRFIEANEGPDSNKVIYHEEPQS